MFFKRSLIATSILLLSGFFMPSFVQSQVEPISRETHGIRLGMSFKEIKKIVGVQEKEDTVVSLMRDFGFGNPDKEAQINQALGKQSFEVVGKLPENLSGIDVFFRKGIVYQIGLH